MKRAASGAAKTPPRSELLFPVSSVSLLSYSLLKIAMDAPLADSIPNCGTPVFAVSNIHGGRVAWLGADFHIRRFACAFSPSVSPPRIAKSISLSANAERPRTCLPVSNKQITVAGSVRISAPHVRTLWQQIEDIG